MDEIEGFWRIWGSQNYDEITVSEKIFQSKKLVTIYYVKTQSCLGFKQMLE